MIRDVSEPAKERAAENSAQQGKPAQERKGPPKVYIPSCGVLCDVFWWARRRDEPPEPSSNK